MPPKVKINKEDIIRAAIDLVRREGATALNARAVAASLGCSTQPVFSNYASMDLLRQAVLNAAEALFQACMQQEVESGKYPPYKATGMAYIRFAKEERELFKLLFMRDRTAEVIPPETSLGNQMESMVRSNTGLEKPEAQLFHLEMWAYVHGIATMVATGYMELEPELVSRILTDAFQGLKHRFEKE